MLILIFNTWIGSQEKHLTTLEPLLAECCLTKNKTMLKWWIHTIKDTYQWEKIASVNITWSSKLSH